MQSRSQNPSSNKLHWSPEEVRQAVWFWILWSIYVCLSAFLATALLTDWPEFLHQPTQYLR
jgi:Trk-type K+ transport system membrane component